MKDFGELRFHRWISSVIKAVCHNHLLIVTTQILSWQLWMCRNYCQNLVKKSTMSSKFEQLYFMIRNAVSYQKWLHRYLVILKNFPLQFLFTCIYNIIFLIDVFSLIWFCLQLVKICTLFLRPICQEYSPTFIIQIFSFLFFCFPINERFLFNPFRVQNRYRMVLMIAFLHLHNYFLYFHWYFH